MVKVKSPGKKVDVSKISAKDFIALRKAPDRLIKLEDGWYRDKYLSILTGKDYVIAPLTLQKHVPHKDGEDYSATFKGGMQPSVEELLTYVDYDNPNKPTIVEGAKVLELSFDDYYWTRTPYPGYPVYARIVDFDLGLVYGNIKGYNYYVRPVRISQ